MSTDLELQLVRVQKELDTLREEFSNYAYSMSHDLASSFRHIDGFASIILSKYEDEFDDKTKRHFDIIVKGAEHGAQLIDAQLEYSRLCTQTLQVSRVDCNVLVSDVLVQLSDVIQNTDAKVTCSELPIVDGDTNQLRQLFHHLIHNALHYRKPGVRPTVAISAEKLENMWQFCITDDGIGIANNQLERVFSISRRAVAKDDYPGSGMGLPIAKSVVQHHGGKIWIESTVDSDCSVHFTLPAEIDNK